MKLLSKNSNFPKKKTIVLGVFVLFFLTMLFLPGTAFAVDAGDIAREIISTICLWFINLLGSYVLLPLINLVVWICSYNEFLGSHAVSVGWPLVRDVSNMFFVVLLLIIAFATILRVSNYSYKNTLVKLILMAILINFSKTIMGFLIDFGQVIMLTFVNAFKNAAAVNLTHAFGIREMLSIDRANDAAFADFEIVAVVLMGVILLVVACGVMLAYVAVLLWRIISLWILVILSPLAFLLSAFPGTAKYASEFWSNFTKQLTTGIILAFFMWLSLMILSAGYDSAGGKTTAGALMGTSPEVTEAQQRTAGGAAQISGDVQWERLYTFIIAVALLLLALKYAQDAGGFAGAFAGKVSGKLSQIGSGAVKGAVGLAKIGKNYGREKLEQWVGLPLNVKEWKEGWMKGVEKRQYRRRQKRIARSSSRKGVLADLGTPGHLFSERWNWGLPKRIFKEGFAGGKIAKKEDEYLDTSSKLKKLKSINSQLFTDRDEETRYNNLKGQYEKGKLSGPGKVRELNEFYRLQVQRDQNMDELLTDEEKEMLVKLKVKNADELDAEINKNFEKTITLHKEISEMRGPVNKELKKELRGDIMEKKKNVTSSEWKELLVELQDAIDRGEFAEAGAILLKATEDGNSNEILNQYNYGSSGDGLKQFILRELVGSKGMSARDIEGYNKTLGKEINPKTGKAYGDIADPKTGSKGLGMSMAQANILQTDAGYAGERILHWQVARTTQSEPSGDMGIMDRDARQLEVAYEMGKQAYDKQLQNGNRLIGYDEQIVGTLEEYKVTGDRDSLIQPSWLIQSINKGPQAIYATARGRHTESIYESLAKDQNYVVWRKIAEEKLQGKQKNEFIGLLNVLREIGLKSLSGKGYDNYSDKKEDWRRQRLDGEQGNLAWNMRLFGLKVDPKNITYDKLKEQYKKDMETFNGTSKVDVKIEGNSMYLDGAKVGDGKNDANIERMINTTPEDIKAYLAEIASKQKASEGAKEGEPVSKEATEEAPEEGEKAAAMPATEVSMKESLEKLTEAINALSKDINENWGQYDDKTKKTKQDDLKNKRKMYIGGQINLALNQAGISDPYDIQQIYRQRKMIADLLKKNLGPIVELQRILSAEVASKLSLDLERLGSDFVSKDDVGEILNEYK